MVNFKNLKIKTQIILGFASILLFVVILGVISFFQSERINLQTVTLYDHPLKTRRAIEDIKTSFLSLHINIRDFLLVEDEESRQKILNEMAVNQANIPVETAKLRQCYLGPPSDIDEFFKEFTKWVSINNETIRMAFTGRLKEARLRQVTGGIAPAQALKVFSELQDISDFAKVKGDELYTSSIKLKSELNKQLFLLVVAILLLSTMIIYILLRHIRRPLNILTVATQRFHTGDLQARSSYVSQNEFGKLSASFNTLAESIQVKTEVDKKFADLAGLMLSEYDVNKFFQATLNALAVHTGSQMAAIYLLSNDETRFEHFESLGVDDNARKSFESDRFEGEFGAAIVTQKIQQIVNKSEDTRFVFYTVSGRFIPHEIITIPVLADNKVVAIISLASINKYDKQAIQLIDNIFVTLCARIEGILAYHKIKEVLDKLALQNRELEAQKTILSAQSSELMAQNTELEIQKKQLDEANRLKTNFLSNMSHELRTPLNSVIALSGVLNRRLVSQIPDEEYSYLEVIERNGKHLLSLINDILDISRIEAGREEIEITVFNANKLVAEIIDLINPQAQEKKIGLLHSNGESDLPVTSDEGKCRHVLQNLIGNAVKFTEKGKVTVSARQVNDTIAITVTDTGIGISEKNLPAVFDEFRQVDGSTSRKFGGTGLGLAIAKKYANLLGGTISVQSIIGKGSEFTFTLPLQYAEGKITAKTLASRGFIQTNTVKNPAETLVPGSKGKTILIVEDSEPAIIQMKDILEDGGYHLLVARNGMEALEITALTIPDAMILDLMMPGIDGFEVLKNLREAETTATIPVLILTARHVTKEELSFLKRNNIHELIQKGDVNRTELLKAVSAMVSSHPGTGIDPGKKIQAMEGKPLVLVVEDNPDNMLTVKALLAGKFTVLEAVDGNVAIEMARKHRPNLILMDIALPDMNGIEVFKTIRKDERLRDIIVIALTASAMTSDRETILAHGFDAYIAKPIDDTVFFNTINQSLYGK